MSLTDNILAIDAKDGSAIRVLFIMATENEYGDALKDAGVKPYIVGVGPINSAMNTMAILKDFEHAGELPDLVINLGSAGSDELEQGVIIQANAVSYRDMDASGFGFPKGETPFSDLPAVLPIGARIPDIQEAAVSTGAKVISNGAGQEGGHNEYDDFAPRVAEMEAYAIYSASLAHGIPMIKLVGISDGHQALEGCATAWEDLLPEIDKKLAQAVLDLKTGLEDGSISRESVLTLPPELSPQATDADASASPAAES